MAKYTFTKALKNKTREGVCFTDAEGGISLQQIVSLRVVSFGLAPIDLDEESMDGQDVSGSTQGNQIIWNGKQFIPVPYDEKYTRKAKTRDGGGSLLLAEKLTDKDGNLTCYFDIFDGKDKNTAGYKIATGRMKQFVAAQKRHGTNNMLTIDLRGVVGLTEQHFEHLKTAADTTECTVEWIVA